MRGWYNIHDHEALRFGFVPYTDSPKTPPRLDSLKPLKALPVIYQPTDAIVDEIEDGLDWYVFLIGTLAGFIGGWISVYLVIKFCNNTKALMIFGG